MPDTVPATPSPVTVALCGYGFAGRNFHAPLIRATDGLALTAIASTRPAAVAADLPDVEVVASLDAACDRADVVVVAGPHHTHAPMTLAALARGRHVVVDKPMSLHAGDARAMAEAARERGRLLMVFHNRRLDNDFLTIRRLAGEGTLGRVVHLESRFDRFRPQVRDRWREHKGPGGGLWFDLGPHLVDQALQLFGPPDAVVASLAGQRSGAETDDWAHVVLAFGERRAVLHASLVAAGQTPRFVVHGTSGSLVKFGLDVQESQLLAGRRPGDAGWGEDPAPATLTDAAGEARPVTLRRGAWEAFYAGVRDAAMGRGPNPVRPDEATAVMVVMDAAFVSAASGRVIAPAFSAAERDALRAAALCR